MLNKNHVIPSLALIVIIVLIIAGPIPQKDSYHHFADQRRILGIGNFMNVITNLPFAYIGLLGIFIAYKVPDKMLRQITYLLFIGFLLLTLGSGYYHLYPNNTTLVYDRIPMSIIFMSFFSFIIYERIDKTTGYLAFVALNFIGIGTIIYWILSEQAGNGDLRWYAMVQFFPIVAIPIILWLYKSPFKHEKYIIPIFLFFGIAKFAESYDLKIYDLLGQTISGHSLKHLFMGVSAFYIIRMMKARTITMP
jgi:hypothetical protein